MRLEPRYATPGLSSHGLKSGSVCSRLVQHRLRSEALERVPAIKDETSQQPIASAWRPILLDLVASIARDDFSPDRLPPSVDRIRPDVAAQIRDYLREFGETLAELSAACWESSVSQWMGDHWDAIIDLWTKESGASDLVLTVRVYEVQSEHRIDVESVLVP